MGGDTETWRAVQAVSGLAFGSFATVHVGTLFLATGSQGLYDAAQIATRELYQQRAIEVGGALAVAAHITANMVLQSRRSPAEDKHTPPATAWHRRSGYVLAIGLLPHAWLLRALPAAHDTQADSSAVTFLLRSRPVLMYSAFGALLVAGVYHIASGTPRALAALGLCKPRRYNSARAQAVINGAAAAGTLLGLAGLASIGGHGAYAADTLRFREFRTVYAALAPRAG